MKALLSDVYNVLGVEFEWTDHDSSSSSGATWSAAQVGANFRKALKQLAKVQAAKPTPHPFEAPDRSGAPDKYVKFENEPHNGSFENFDLSDLTTPDIAAAVIFPERDPKPVKLPRSVSYGYAVLRPLWLGLGLALQV